MKTRYCNGQNHKKSILLILSFFLLFNSYGQDNLANVVSPDGGSYIGEAMVIDYSLGNWTVLNMDNSNGQIANGISHEYLITVSTTEQTKDNFQLKVYPNPTTEWIFLKLIDATVRPERFNIVDATGRLIVTGVWPNSTNEVKINLKNLVSNIYYLKMIGDNDEILKSLKFIKIK